MSARKLEYGERVYGVLVRLSPDVPLSSRELGHCVYYGTPDTVDGKDDRHSYRMRMVIDVMRRKMGWDIRRRYVGRRNGGGYILSREHYLLVRAAFGYCRDLGGPRVDWRHASPLRPEHLRELVAKAIRAEAFDATGAR